MRGVSLLSAATFNPDPFIAAIQGVGTLSRLKSEPEWLRSAIVTAPPIGVDRQAGIIRGRILAEKGPFKSLGRGEFDDESLDKIVKLANELPNGLKSRFTHPGLSADGLGKYLGRDRNVRKDGDKVRGDLHLDRTALESAPDGGTPLGKYVMDLAESDPGAFGSSLVLRADQKYRLNEDGTKKQGPDGKELPPLWRPTKLHAIDVVDDGDAVHSGFLSADLPDSAVREASSIIDQQFAGCDRPTIEARATAFLSRYLDLRFGEDDMNAPPADPKPQPTKPPPPPPPPPPQPSGELATWITEQRAALQADLDAAQKAVQERLKAEQQRAAAADEMACLKQAEALNETGKVTPAALGVAPGFVSLGTFLHLLDNSESVTVETLNGKEQPVTLRSAFLKLLPTLRPQTGGERLTQTEGDDRLSQRKRIKEWSDRQNKAK